MGERTINPEHARKDGQIAAPTVIKAREDIKKAKLSYNSSKFSLKNKHLIHEKALVIILDKMEERVVIIQKIISLDEVYVRYYKGKASECRKMWVIPTEAVLRKATQQEITKAERRG